VANKSLADRPELRDWKRRHCCAASSFYIMLALIPVPIFGLFLWVAKH